MPHLGYRIENAPGKLYGKNANDLGFKEPLSGALMYSTTTVSGVLKNTKKHLFRGPISEKDGGVCVATIDEPSSGTLEMHHLVHPSPTTSTTTEENTTAETTTTSSSTLKIKKASWWVPFSGNNNHAVTFRDAKYTWHGITQLKRDSDGHVVAKLANPWFWQGKLGDMEVDITSSAAGKGEALGSGADDDREVLEMVLATFVLRWWGEKVKAEQEAAEKKRHQEELRREKELEKKAVASQKEEQEQKRKKEEIKEAENRKQDTGEETVKL